MKRFIALLILAVLVASCGMHPSQEEARCGSGMHIGLTGSCVHNRVYTHQDAWCGYNTERVGYVCLGLTIGFFFDPCLNGTALVLRDKQLACERVPVDPSVRVECGPGSYLVDGVCHGGLVVDPQEKVVECGIGTERIVDECGPS